MYYTELKRYVNSRFTYGISLVLIIITGISYYSTYLDKDGWAKVLKSGAKDFNIEKTQEIVNSYTATYYFENLLFSGNTSILIAMVILIGLGIAISSKSFEAMSSNYGTMVITRTSYKKYLLTTLLAQATYVMIFIVTFFSLIYFLSVLIIPGGFSPSSSSILKGISSLKYSLFILISIVHMAAYITLVVLIASVSPVFLKNKYAIQFLPFAIVMITYLLGNIIGSINQDFGLVSSFMVINGILFAFKNAFTSTQSIVVILLQSFSFIILALIVLIKGYKMNLKSFTKDYINE